MLFDEYLKNIPHLHTWDGGVTWNSGGFEDYHLRAFKKYVASGARRVIETGAEMRPWPSILAHHLNL